MQFDHLEKRCPRLGNPVSFVYCRTSEGGGEPCFKVLDCWWEDFDVRAYFSEKLSPEDFNRLLDPSPPNKVASLVDLIEQARHRLDEGS